MPNIYLPIITSNPHTPIGVQIDGNISSQLPFIGNNSFVHYQIEWDDAHQPTPDSEIQWQEYRDTEMNSLRPWRVMLGIKNSPTWARQYPPAECSAPKPEHMQKYVDFVYALCLRYRPWMVCVWNEPEVTASDSKGLGTDHYFGGLGLALAPYYGQIISAVYDAICPLGIPLVAGELLLANTDFWGVAKQYCSGKYDYVSFHAYSEWLTTWGEVRRKADLLRSLGEERLICTETNYIWHLNGTHADTFDQDQADYIQYLVDNFSTLNVEYLSIYAMQSGWRGADLIRGGNPRPSHAVYFAATTQSRR